MDEMIRYIFKNMRNSETALKFMTKNLRRQKAFNRTAVWFATAMMICASVQSMRIRSLHQKIDILQKEINECKEETNRPQ